MQKIISKALIATLLLGGVVAYEETNSATENAWGEASVNTTVSLEIATTTRAQAKEALQNLVKISQGLQKNLNDARVSLAKAVGNLRGLKVKTDVEATTTAQVNSQN